MEIGNTKAAATDIQQGGVHFPKRRVGQEAENKIVKVSMYLKGNITAGGLEEITTEDRESDHKEVT